MSLSLYSKSFEKLLSGSLVWNVHCAPVDFRSQLKEDKNIQKFLKRLRKFQKYEMRTITKLTLIHWLMFYYQGFEFLIDEMNKQFECQDKWFRQNIMKAYYLFLKKCSYSYEQYSCSRQNKLSSSFFQELFYMINLLKQLETISSNILQLGYSYEQRTEISIFVQMVTLQFIHLYESIKKIVSYILIQPDDFCSYQQKKIIRDILQNTIPQFNQEVKVLLNNQHFEQKYEKYEIQLRKIQQLTQIIQTTKNNTGKTGRSQSLKDILAPNTNESNFQIYEEWLLNTTKSIQSRNLVNEVGLIFKQALKQAQQVDSFEK